MFRNCFKIIILYYADLFKCSDINHINGSNSTNIQELKSMKDKVIFLKSDESSYMNIFFNENINGLNYYYDDMRSNENDCKFKRNDDVFKNDEDICANTDEYKVIFAKKNYFYENDEKRYDNYDIIQFTRKYDKNRQEVKYIKEILDGENYNEFENNNPSNYESNNDIFIKQINTENNKMESKGLNELADLHHRDEKSAKYAFISSQTSFTTNRKVNYVKPLQNENIVRGITNIIKNEMDNKNKVMESNVLQSSIDNKEDSLFLLDNKTESAEVNSHEHHIDTEYTHQNNYIENKTETTSFLDEKNKNLTILLKKANILLIFVN